MNNKTKGVIAGIAGLALLGGGTTFALWSDSANLAGATITNGNLDVTASAMTWVDASTDRTDANHSIDLATWRMVPGDTARGTVELDVELEGDNLAATLGVDTAAATLPTGVTATYDVIDANDDVVANDVALGTDTTVTVGASGTYTVVVDVTFGNVNNQVSTEASATLSAITVNLQQVRTGTGFNTP